MKYKRFVGVFSLVVLFGSFAWAQQVVPHTIHDGNVSDPRPTGGEALVPYCQFAVLTNNMTLDVDPGVELWRHEDLAHRRWVAESRAKWAR